MAGIAGKRKLEALRQKFSQNTSKDYPPEDLPQRPSRPLRQQSQTTRPRSLSGSRALWLSSQRFHEKFGCEWG